MKLLKALKTTERFKSVYKRGGIFLLCFVLLFFSIGILTTIAPTYRLSSDTISKWTSDLDSRTLLYLFGTENRYFKKAIPKDEEMPKITTTLFQVLTNIKPDDPKSLLGQELPGFKSFGNKIIIAGDGTNYANLSIESSPPLEDVLKDREAINEEKEVETPPEKKTPKLTTGEKQPVFIYSTHNRESFLPHLPKSTTPNEAHHKEVNITKVAEHFNKSLQDQGVGAKQDSADIMTMLNEKDMNYSQSYKMSRNVVKEALATNKDIKYVFDIHRDSLPRKQTTLEINGKNHAKLLFVVGSDHPNYEKNLQLATKLHYLIEKRHKGLSRGVIQKGGAGSDGIYNQDISGNAVLVEMGGYDNKLEELYRSADVLADVFSEYFWDAEKVNYEKKEDSDA